MSSQVEQLAVSALRDWLLWKLPAKVTAINAARFATLRATTPGPYTIPASATLGLSHTANSATFTSVALTAGSRTTAQLVTEINAAIGGATASADSADRLLLTSPAAPTASTPSKYFVRGGTATDCNSVFGWDAGGEKELLTALVAPGRKGVCNGLPLQPDFGPAGVVAIILGNRSGKPVAPASGSPRRDEHLVVVDLDVLRIEPQQQTSATREHIESALRCVREVLLTDEGRMLGRATNGDVLRVDILSAVISATPHVFKSKQPISNPRFEGAAVQLAIRVYERPSAT